MNCDDGETCTKPAIHFHTEYLYSPQPEILEPRQEEAKIGAPQPEATGDRGPITTDGTCGASNGNTVCGNWEKGSCCSLFGVDRHPPHSDQFES